jgi:hypothetical protein
MFNFEYTFTRDGDILCFKATGFTTYDKGGHLVESIIKEIETAKNEGRPYKILFDLRGLKALDPRTTTLVKELDQVVYESSAVKVGTVLDNILAQIQQKRLIGTEYDLKERGLLTSDYEKCLAWLKE